MGNSVHHDNTCGAYAAFPAAVALVCDRVLPSWFAVSKKCFVPLPWLCDQACVIEHVYPVYPQVVQYMYVTGSLLLAPQHVGYITLYLPKSNACHNKRYAVMNRSQHSGWAGQKGGNLPH